MRLASIDRRQDAAASRFGDLGVGFFRAFLFACASIQLFRIRWILLSSGALFAFVFFHTPQEGSLQRLSVAAPQGDMNVTYF